MINKIKTLILSIGTLMALSVPVIAPVAVSAATTDIHGSLCQGADINITKTGGGKCETNGAEDPNQKIKTVINWISAVIGVVAVIMIIYGGFRYITSGGNDTSVAAAKKTILFALIGLVIVALSQLIVKFVLQNVS